MGLPDNEALWKLVIEQQSTLAANQQTLLNMQEQYKHHQREEEHAFKAIAQTLEELKKQQQVFNDIILQTRGGWKMLVIMITVTTTLTGAMAWLWVHVLNRAQP